MKNLDQPRAPTFHIFLAGIFGSLLAAWMPVLLFSAGTQLAAILTVLAVLTGWLPGLFGSILGEIAWSKTGGKRAAWQLALAFLAGLVAVFFAWQTNQPNIF